MSLPELLGGPELLWEVKGFFFQDFIFLAFYVLVTDKKILESHGYFKKKISASYFIGD